MRTAAGSGTDLDSAFRRLALHPGSKDAWFGVGDALTDADRHDKAHAAFLEASSLDQADLRVALRVARSAVRAGTAEVELARQRRSRDRTPASLLIQLHILGHLGQVDEAETLANELTAMCPASPEVAGERAARALAKGDDRTTDEALRHAVTLNPRDTGLRHELGKVLLRTGRPAAARSDLERCLDDTQDASILLDLALAELQLGHQRDALGHARAALALGGCEPAAWRLIATISAYAPDVGGVELTDTMRRAGSYAAGVAAKLRSVDRNPDRPLRLGLLGGAFWRHPSTWLTLRGIEHLDRSQFEIHCFSPDLVADDFTSRWKARSTGWHATRGRSDQAVAAAIRSCKIDILIDLGGCLDIGRLNVLNHRAAPVQIKWVGAQFHTTGLPAVDWFVGDRYETPADLSDLYTERLLVLPDSYVCYDPPTNGPAVPPLPLDHTHIVTFGSFNNLMKITPDVIDVWTRILREVDGSRLLLKAPQFDEQAAAASLLSAFEHRGIDRGRLRTEGQSDHAAMLAAYASVDIALQPFPYGGGVTLLESLWMGVPSVAMVGETFASRHGLSHLSNVGLADCVAANADAYVATATALARDPARLRHLRSSLRERLASSPICDGTRFGTEFGTLLRRAWIDHCASP